MTTDTVTTPTNDLAGRVAVVTGSSSGIGEACARSLAALGAHVVVNSSSSVEAGQRVAAEIGGESIYVQADITDADQRASMLSETIDRYGRLDMLVNNAGWTTVVPHDDLDALTDEIIRRTFEVNVFATLALTKEALAHLRESPDGNVVFVTSIAGVRPVGSSIAYAMTKAALNHLTALLAKSHGPVRFNAVAPGLVVTPWTADWDAQHEWVAKTAPAGRSSTAHDQAAAVVACATNPYMTGAVLVVDGGLTLAV